MTDRIPSFPRIQLSPEECALYDDSAKTFLDQAVNEFSNYRGSLDPHAWSHVRSAGDMSIYKSAYGVRDPQVTLMLGVGTIPGTINDVMSGIYCDTTEDLRTVRTLLKHPLLDAGVFNVTERKSEEEPFRFAGIKWFSAKVAWGITTSRDVLAYERMGRTKDAQGRELAFHVLYSIDRPEWPIGGIKGIKREHQITCFLYRQLDDGRVETFLWGTIYRLGSVSQRLAEYAVAGVFLAVTNAPTTARARKLTNLMSNVPRSAWTGAVGNLCCYTCRGQPFLSSNRPCAGCSQFVCKSCSANEKVFALDLRSRRIQTRRFCRYCINKTAVSAEQSFEKSVVQRRRNRRKAKGSRSIDAAETAAAISSAVPTAQRQKPGTFSSARHNSDVGDTSRSYGALKFSDLSDSDWSESDNDEHERPKGLTAADLVSLSREPTKNRRIVNNHKLMSFGGRGHPGKWNRAANEVMPMHDEEAPEMVMLEASSEDEDDPAAIDTYHQSPDGVDQHQHLLAASGLSQFDLEMNLTGGTLGDSVFTESSDLDASFNANRTVVMPRSLRRKQQPTLHEEGPDDKTAFLSELYSLSMSQVRHGPRQSPPSRTGSIYR